jgi:hypothetical protein
LQPNDLKSRPATLAGALLKVEPVDPRYSPQVIENFNRRRNGQGRAAAAVPGRFHVAGEIGQGDTLDRAAVVILEVVAASLKQSAEFHANTSRRVTGIVAWIFDNGNYAN